MHHFIRTALAFCLMAGIRTAVTARDVAGRGDKKVYVCVSRGSVAYHTSSTCEGLGQCTHIVRSVTPVVAQKLGKRACYKCYPGLAVRPVVPPLTPAALRK